MKFEVEKPDQHVIKLVLSRQELNHLVGDLEDLIDGESYQWVVIEDLFNNLLPLRDK